MKSTLIKITKEIGLKAIYDSPRDVKILCLQRMVRLAAYGGSTLILVLYLVDLGNSTSRTGLFMTLTLVGDVIISLLLTIIADKLGRRKLLAVGSLLMTASGIVFSLVGNFWFLLLASVLGVISPSGNEIGPFKAIEESTIAHLTPAADRSGVLAWYTLSGTAGVALGTIASGWVVRVLQVKYRWETIPAYRVIWTAYAVMGLVKFSLCLLLSKKCEADPEPVPVPAADDERRPLLANGGHEQEVKKDSVGSKLRNLIPRFSQETRSLIFKLGLLFAMDSLASGLSTNAWMIYFFSTKFGLAEQKLGNLFFVTNLVSSASNLVASSLAQRIGLVKTMVFTHAPASIALALIPVPGNVIIAMALLIFRASTNSMDQAPRQAFLAAAVLPAERTSVMGMVNVIKTLSQSIGPIITGRLAGVGKFWIAFLMAGTLKVLYDVLLLGMFLGYKTVEDKAQQIVDHPEETDDASEDERRSR